MKNLTRCFFILLFFCLSCNNDPVIPKGNGTASANLNGGKWEAIANAIKINAPHNTFSVGLKVYNNDGFLREYLSFFKVPKKIGKYEINSRNAHDTASGVAAVYFSVLDDGDVEGDKWILLQDSLDAVIEITHYNASSGLIKGNFEVTLVVDTTGGRGRTDPQRPDTLKFVDGKFEANIGD